MRAWLASLLLVSLAAPDLATGLRQVREGDFEGAVVTLQAVVAQLGPNGPPRDLSQAHLYLGIAQLALDKRDEAKARFLDALKYDPQLTLSPTAFSPKVLALFAEAREERARTRAPESKGSGSKVALIVGGAAAVGAGVVLATRGDEQAAPPGATEVTNARFGRPMEVCPNDSAGVLLPINVRVDVANGGDSALVIAGATVVLRITRSPANPMEVGTESSLPVRLSADRVAPRVRATLTLMTDLVCGNDGGDPPRSNEWLAQVTLTTSAGTFQAETADRLTVSIP
jgi:hypothetical protein